MRKSTLVYENVFISYGGCGIPYYVSGEIQNLDDLRSTPYHTVRDADFFRDMKGITVRTQTRATAIDRTAKTLAVKNVGYRAGRKAARRQTGTRHGCRPRASRPWRARNLTQCPLLPWPKTPE